MTHDLYVALCTHHPKSHHLPSPSLPLVGPLYPVLLPYPLPLVTTMLLSICIYEFVLYLTYVHCSIIHSGQGMDTTKVSFDRIVEKEDVVHVHNEHCSALR